jgi:hypothetical protein
MHPHAIYRRCPSCQVVRQASAFQHATSPTFAPGQIQRRRCPACSHVGPLVSFTITPRPESDQEGAN